MPFKDRGLWRGTATVNGQRRTKGFKLKAEAEAWEAKHRGLISSAPLGLFEVTGRYLKQFQTSVQPKTYRKKKAVLKRFLAHLGDRPMSSILPGDIESYLSTQGKRTPTAYNDDLKCIRSLWAWAGKMYDLPNQARRIDFKPVSKAAQYVPSSEDVKTILGASYGEWRVWLITYLYTGAREREIYRLKWEDVDFETGRIRLFSRKNKTRELAGVWLPMPSELVAELVEWKELTPHDSEYVFPNRWGGEMNNARFRLQIMCKNAGIRYIPFHALRRFVGTALARAGEPMQHIQRVLRHTNLSTTERYLDAAGVDISATMSRLGSLVKYNRDTTANP